MPISNIIPPRISLVEKENDSSIFFSVVSNSIIHACLIRSISGNIF